MSSSARETYWLTCRWVDRGLRRSPLSSSPAGLGESCGACPGRELREASPSIHLCLDGLLPLDVYFICRKRGLDEMAQALAPARPSAFVGMGVGTGLWTHSAGQARRSPELGSTETERLPSRLPGPFARPAPPGWSVDRQTGSCTHRTSRQNRPTQRPSRAPTCPQPTPVLKAAHCLGQAFGAGHVPKVHPRVGEEVLEGDAAIRVPL